MSDADYRAFERWLSDPANAREFEIAEQIWASAPDFVAAEARAAQPPRAARLTRRWGLAGATGALAAAVMAWFVFLGPVATEQLVAGKGERTQATLSDESNVYLNADTRLTAAFDRRRRRVALLGGEAFFEVAPDPDRPFVVSAGDVRVTAVGTQFNVRSRQSGRVRVDVLEGEVAVEAGNWRGSARAGEQIEITQGRARVALADRARVEGWRNGQIVLQSVPLVQVVEELNAYSATPIVIADPAIGRRLVSGRFDGARAQEALAALEFAIQVRVVPLSDGSLQLVDNPRDQ
jgi:transmembrane sensor